MVKRFKIKVNTVLFLILKIIREVKPKSIVEQKKHTKKIFDWIASIFLISAGILISGKFKYFEYSYILFFIGHLIYIINFIKQKEYSYVSANIFFLSIDMLGIYKWIL
jgi:uncharacterized membrane protein YhhN